jgi:hypothetical protein
MLFQQDRGNWDNHTTNRTEGRDAASFNLRQMRYLTLCHARCGFFNGIAQAFALYEDNRMA